jgi:hypothetical protein
MAERYACITVSASAWFEIIGGAPAPDLEQHEYRLRCRVVRDGSSVVMVVVYEVDASGRFRPLVFGPALHSIPKFKILRDEPWNRDEVECRIIEPQSYRSDGERWRPKALVITHQGGSVGTEPVSTSLDQTFATEEEANTYAVKMAKRWVDEHS